MISGGGKSHKRARKKVEGQLSIGWFSVANASSPPVGRVGLGGCWWVFRRLTKRFSFSAAPPQTTYFDRRVGVGESSPPGSFSFPSRFGQSFSNRRRQDTHPDPPTPTKKVSCGAD